MGLVADVLSHAVMPGAAVGFALAGSALAVATLAPSIARAQAAPLQLGVLTPLTGAGGFDGPRMAKAMQGLTSFAEVARVTA